jgi:integrase
LGKLESAIQDRSAKVEDRPVSLTYWAREIILSPGEDLSGDQGNQHVTREFTASMRKAGLQGFNLHSLRHTFAKRLIELGVDVLTVSKILGHSDIKPAMVYAKTQFSVM